MANPSAREQLMLELINRARLDPAAEANRFGISLNAGLSSGTISAASKAPLAMNSLLIDSSRAHSTWMLDRDVFSHTGKSNSSPGDRMKDAGYVFSGSWTWGENIAWTGTTGTLDATAAIIEQHKGLFLSAGHRTNILGGNFREIGVGQVLGNFSKDGTTYKASMVTQNFAASGTAIHLTGVIYDDASGDDFYSIGEGEGGVSIAAGSRKATSTSSGGYKVEVGKSTTVKIVFGKGSGAVEAEAAIRSENAKVDLVDGNTLFSSVSLTLLKNVKAATLLGLDDRNLTGSSTSQTLTGNKGDNRLDGKQGNDKLAGGGGKDVLIGGAGTDRLTGGSGADKLTGGSEADTFVFLKISDSKPAKSQRDTIVDFKRPDGDRIDLKAIDARADKAGNDAFSFIAKKAFSGKAGELRYEKSGSSVVVLGDVDGDRKADFAIEVASTSKLIAADFIL